jgi:hypothetical protein
MKLSTVTGTASAADAAVAEAALRSAIARAEPAEMMRMVDVSAIRI